MLSLLVSSLLYLSGGGAGGGAGEFQVLDRCTDSHVAAAVESMQLCAPRPVIVALPWPSNKQIHQVTCPILPILLRVSNLQAMMNSHCLLCHQIAYFYSLHPVDLQHRTMRG